jgi:calcineurin-like phosphoesterase family protein
VSEIWVVSDTHFGHSNIIKYCFRPFSSAEEMDEEMIERWNKVVTPEDHVYHLGDVYFSKDSNFQYRLNGKKRLILGNHDNGKDDTLLKMFQKIMVWRMFPDLGLLLTHVPCHPDGLSFKDLTNVHGHIHEKIVTRYTEYENRPDPRYKNVSVEQIDYTPVNIEALRTR